MQAAASAATFGPDRLTASTAPTISSRPPHLAGLLELELAPPRSVVVALRRRPSTTAKYSGDSQA